MGGSGLERAQQPIPELGGVSDLFQRYRIGGRTRDTGKRGDHARCQHQVVEADRAAVIKQHLLALPVHAATRPIRKVAAGLRRSSARMGRATSAGEMKQVASWNSSGGNVV